MDLQNAKKGVGLIYKGEILSVCAAILGAVSAVILVFTASKGGGTGISDGGLAGIGLIVLLTGLALLVAFLFQIIGISKASKVEPDFKKAMAFLIVGLIAGIIAGLIGNHSEMLKDIAGIVSSFCDLMVTLYIIQGCINLAKTVGNNQVESLASSTLKMIVALYVVTITLNIVMAFISSEKMELVAGILSIVIAVITIICYVLFLKVLSNTKNAL